MKLSRFLSIATLVTCFSLLYVYQQTEIFRLAYLGQKRQVILEDLLDKNSLLRYNIQSNASLVDIGNKISGSADFQMPESYRLMKFTSSQESLSSQRKAASKKTILSRLFGIKRQAEAKTIESSTALGLVSP